jgi:hypothetical protein
VQCQSIQDKWVKHTYIIYMQRLINDLKLYVFETTIASNDIGLCLSLFRLLGDRSKID